ncbi:MAG TPA: hypothetical protein VJL84_12620 [Kiloniellales bacterium]|nr:hypothetical protein [Kiloniellales bacterium]
MTTRLLPLLLLLALPLAARAGEFAVEPGTTFSYTDRPGLCRIDAGHSQKEADLLAMFEAADGETLVSLLTLYDCPFVESLTTATPGEPALWVRIVTARQGGQLVVLPLDRKEFLEQIGGELETVLGGQAGPDLENVLQKAVERVNQEVAPTSPGGFQLSKVEPLGILARDADALYAGIVGVVSLGGDQATVLTLLGVTQLEGRPITVYLSRPYTGAEMVPAQLEETRVMVADLIQRNDPEGGAGSEAGGFDWGRIALYAAIGAGIGLIAALLLRARKRRGAG